MTRSADDAGAPDASVPREHFDVLYEGSSDPWDLRSAWYERRKYAITVAALPRERYRSGLEPGCSIGELTRLLAARCDSLLAFDFAQSAVDSARRAVLGMPHVAVERRALPAGLPPGSFDLIVLSEVLYYLSAPDLARTVDGMTARLDVGGDLVAVHHPRGIAATAMTGTTCTRPWPHAGSFTRWRGMTMMTSRYKCCGRPLRSGTMA
jgi:SAM-dependent methyltransferase